MNCGLLGRKLGHSYSPAIHGLLGKYTYDLFEKEPEALETFLRSVNFTGLNVTIPYKKAVLPYCDELTDCAKKLGAVNTIVRRKDGILLGHNSDYFGFSAMVEKNAKIEFLPEQNIAAIPKSAEHSANIYRGTDAQILYLRQAGLGIIEIDDVLKEAFLNDF